MIWYTRLTRLPRISLIRMARKIGTGNCQRRRDRLISKVLRIAFIAAGVENMRWKFAQPTHYEPQMPSRALYFLNASTSPLIGW